MSWVIALGGETLEKLGLGGGRKRFIFRTFNYRRPADPLRSQDGSYGIEKDDAIEAEFTKK
jgi:hypothetical protein